MHLVCIGVRKKDWNTWVSGKSDKHRFSDQIIKNISAYLLAIGEYISNVFPRTHRPLHELPRWKVTELRLDLLHVCSVAYKPFLEFR
jgi:hypothetical protein